MIADNSPEKDRSRAGVQIVRLLKLIFTSRVGAKTSGYGVSNVNHGPDYSGKSSFLTPANVRDFQLLHDMVQYSSIDSAISLHSSFVRLSGCRSVNRPPNFRRLHTR